jgi:hypothetical protein
MRRCMWLTFPSYMYMLINYRLLEFGSIKCVCATLSANVNINDRLPIKVYYRICTLRHIRIEISHGTQNVFWVLTWVGGYCTNIRQPMLKLKTHSGFHDLFLNYIAIFETNKQPTSAFQCFIWVVQKIFTFLRMKWERK